MSDDVNALRVQLRLLELRRLNAVRQSDWTKEDRLELLRVQKLVEADVPVIDPEVEVERVALHRQTLAGTREQDGTTHPLLAADEVQTIQQVNEAALTIRK